MCMCRLVEILRSVGAEHGVKECWLLNGSFYFETPNGFIRVDPSEVDATVQTA